MAKINRLSRRTWPRFDPDAEYIFALNLGVGNMHFLRLVVSDTVEDLPTDDEFWHAIERWPASYQALLEYLIRHSVKRFPVNTDDFNNIVSEMKRMGLNPIMELTNPDPASRTVLD